MDSEQYLQEEAAARLRRAGDSEQYWREEAAERLRRIVRVADLAKRDRDKLRDAMKERIKERDEWCEVAKDRLQRIEELERENARLRINNSLNENNVRIQEMMNGRNEWLEVAKDRLQKIRELEQENVRLQDQIRNARLYLEDRWEAQS